MKRGLDLSARLKFVRTQAGMSQDDFAAKLGVSLSTVQKWEREGEGLQVRSGDLMKVVEAFRADPTWLLTGEINGSPWIERPDHIPLVRYVAQLDPATGLEELTPAATPTTILALSHAHCQSYYGVEPGNLFLWRPTDESMKPAYQTTDILILERPTGPPAHGDFCLVRHRGRIVFRGVCIPDGRRICLFCCDPNIGKTRVPEDEPVENLGRLLSALRIVAGI